MGVVIEPHLGIDLFFVWFHAACAKLFERIRQDENITLKRRKFNPGGEIVCRSVCLENIRETMW